MDEHRSGFVTIIGRPNVGKSTLLNNILGEKIAIISSKPQTTRKNMIGVYHGEQSQIIFVDTPGMHRPKNKLGEYMVNSANNSLKEVDLVLMMVDESKKIGPGDQYIVDMLKTTKTKKLLLINKIDLLGPEEFRSLYETYDSMDVFDEIMGISALDGKNIQALIGKIEKFLPEGPKYYPDDMLTDQTEKAIVADMIREKLLNYLNDEVPHGIAVEIDKMKVRSKKEIIDIDAIIVTEKESHKGIIIGKKGRKLKGIGKSSREEIERFLGMQVNLQLWVKVRTKWRDSDTFLKNFGYKD